MQNSNIDDNIYSCSYEGRQLYKIKDNISEIEFNKRIYKITDDIQKTIDEFKNIPKQDSIESEYCSWSKMRLFGNVYKCNTCDNNFNMTCGTCLESQNRIICYNCNILILKLAISSEDIKLFLNTYFMNITNENFIIKTEDKEFIITCIKQFDKLIEIYNKYLNHNYNYNYNYNFFYFLTNIEQNILDFLKELFNINNDNVNKINIIRNSKGQLIMLINDSVPYDFDIFDFCLIYNNDVKGFEFESVYDILTKKGKKLHIKNKNNKSIPKYISFEKKDLSLQEELNFIINSELNRTSLIDKYNKLRAKRLAKAEAEKAKAIAEQAQAEKAKADEEKAKAIAEQAQAEKAKAEEEKAKAIAEQAQAEKAKAEAEKAKAIAEKARAKRLAKAEAEKAQAEKARANAEKARANAEKARANAEKARAKEEEARAKAKEEEAKRIAQLEAEKAKAKAKEEEAEKAQVKKAKAEAEKAKAEAEKAKAEAEKAKAEAEAITKIQSVVRGRRNRKTFIQKKAEKARANAKEENAKKTLGINAKRIIDERINVILSTHEKDNNIIEELVKRFKTMVPKKTSYLRAYIKDYITNHKNYYTKENKSQDKYLKEDENLTDEDIYLSVQVYTTCGSGEKTLSPDEQILFREKSSTNNRPSYCRLIKYKKLLQKYKSNNFLPPGCYKDEVDKVQLKESNTAGKQSVLDMWLQFTPDRTKKAEETITKQYNE